MGTTYTVTNSFSADTTAVAIEVNTNFSDVLTALNAFDASNLSSGALPLARISGLTTTQFASTTLVIESEGISSNDNDTTIPTCAAVRDYVDNNEAATKYSINPMTGGNDSTGTITFPNGLIWKWGKTTSIATSASRTVTFAVAFPNACFCAIVNMHRSSGIGVYVPSVHSITAASIGIKNQSSVVVIDATWFAVGR